MFIFACCLMAEPVKKFLRISAQNDQMYEYDELVARAAECQWKAKTARNEDDKHSWLALADSWLQTAELQQVLKRLEQDNPQKAVA